MRLKKALENPENPPLDFLDMKKVFTIETNNFAGRADLIRDHIYIELRACLDYDELVSVFFHEYAHIWMKYNRKYSAYIRCFESKNYSRKEHKAAIRVWLKAEMYADQKAEELCSIYCPEVEFLPGYTPDVADQCRQENELMLKDPKAFEQDYQDMKQFVANLRRRKDAIYT